MPKVTNNDPQLDEDSITNEERRLVDKFQKTFYLRDTYGPSIEQNLKKNMNKLIKHIALYREKNIHKLETPYPCDYPVWTPKDTQIYFDVCGINKDDFRDTINTIPLPDDYNMQKKFITNKDVHLIALMIIREMWKQKMDQKYIDILTYYMGYSYYWQAFTVSFRKYKPDKRVMEYTINNMSNRFFIKQLGSVNKLIYYAAKSALDTYKKDIEEGSDYKSFIWVSDRFVTKFKGYVISIAKVYYENFKDKNRIYTSNVTDDEGVEYENESGVADAISYANKYTARFFANPPSETWINWIAKQRGISVVDLRNSIQLLADNNDNYEEVRAFYQAMFYLFIVGEGNPAKDISTKKFIIEMNKVYKKGNSNDKNVIIIKDYLDKWLKAGSATYRASNRADTLNRFRRGTFEYFVYTAVSNK